STVLESSFIGNIGIGQLNQDAGIASSQANLVLITVGINVEGEGFQSVGIYSAKALTGNTLVVEGGSRSNSIQNSFANATAIVQVNQNTGALNQQLNVTALSIGSFIGGSFVALGDSGLAGVAADNQFTSLNAGPRSDTIDASFSGFRGVAQITQSSGDGNSITN